LPLRDLFNVVFVLVNHFVDINNMVLFIWQHRVATKRYKK
jgi:hypothetical protein